MTYFHPRDFEPDQPSPTCRASGRSAQKLLRAWSSRSEAARDPAWLSVRECRCGREGSGLGGSAPQARL